MKKKQYDSMGSTGITAYINETNIVTAGLGDSRIVLCKNNGGIEEVRPTNRGTCRGTSTHILISSLMPLNRFACPLRR